MIVMTVLSLVVAVSVMLFQRTLVEQTLERARNLEKDRANQLVRTLTRMCLNTLRFGLICIIAIIF